MNTAATEIQDTCDWCGAVHPLNDIVFCVKPRTEVERIMLGMACMPHAQLRCEPCLGYGPALQAYDFNRMLEGAS